MKENKSHNKIIFLSLTLLVVFLLQFTLGLVGNFILMIAMHILLSICLVQWFKDKRTTLTSKLVLGLISLLLMGSFLFHNYEFIGILHYFAYFWGILLFFEVVEYVFKKRKNKSKEA